MLSVSDLGRQSLAEDVAQDFVLMDGNPKPTFSVGSAPTARLRPSFFLPFVRNRDVKEKARAVVEGTTRAFRHESEH